MKYYLNKEAFQVDIDHLMHSYSDFSPPQKLYFNMAYEGKPLKNYKGEIDAYELNFGHFVWKFHKKFVLTEKEMHGLHFQSQMDDLLK